MTKITTHVLNTTLGKPAENVAVSLHFLSQGVWAEIGTGKTDKDGRLNNWIFTETFADAGFYKIKFETGSYFSSQQITSFYPFIEIHFTVNSGQEHYHVPLLLNPYGYTTYRGS